MSDAYGDADLVPETPDPLFRPVWEDTPDETELLPGEAIARERSNCAPPNPPDSWLHGSGLSTLLCLLCDAQDALVRLDASAAAAPPAVRDGLCVRMAFGEAAGWLAYAHAWVHPLDLALTDLGLIGSYAIATHIGRPMRGMPNTYVRRGSRAWEEQDTAGMLAGEAAGTTALALARQLMRLTRMRTDPFGTFAGASATLNQFGPAGLDSTRFVQWRTGIARNAGPPSDGASEGAGEGARVQQLPPLLAAARAAERWISGGIVELPNSLQAYLAAAGVLVGDDAIRAVIPPFWAAYPALGRPAIAQDEELALLRSDVLARLSSPAGRSLPAWLISFLHLVAEGARAAMRELGRLLDMAERGRALIAGYDRRSRLPAALDAALRRPVLTPKALAAELGVAPQTATALLRELRAAQLVTEITGRRSFRAFALVAP